MKYRNLLIVLVVATFAIMGCVKQGDGISNEGSEEISVPTDVASSDNEVSNDPEIVGILWLWERYDDTAGLNDIVVEDPSLYTLLLNDDGSYEVKADCNLATGRYTQESSSLKFEVGPTTLAECGPDSLSNTFLEDLGYVATFVMDGERLVLNLWADAGNMVFVMGE